MAESTRTERSPGTAPRGFLRPTRVRHRLLLAGLLTVGFAVTVGPAMDSLKVPAVRPAASSAAANSTAAGPAAGTANGTSYGSIPRTTDASLGVAPVSYRPAAERAPAQQAPMLQAVPAVLPAPAPTPPTPPSPPGAPGELKVSVDGGPAGRNQVIQIIIMMTILSVAPSLLLLCTSFTKIAVVLSLTRNALGTPTIPPNQVLAGMALFLSLFVMSPVLTQMNEKGVQPYLNNQMELSQAIDQGGAPLRLFMAEQTGDMELQTMIKMSKSPQPKNKADTDFKTLIPAFVLSELKSAFIIGFVIFIPFLIIDLVVSSVLMSMGMMMLPPVMISLPFKMLLFVMVDGWSLITTALVTSYR